MFFNSFVVVVVCVFSFTVGVDYRGCVVVSVCVRVFFHMFICFAVALFSNTGDNTSCLVAVGGNGDSSGTSSGSGRRS